MSGSGIPPTAEPTGVMQQQARTDLCRHCHTLIVGIKTATLEDLDIYEWHHVTDNGSMCE